MDANKNILDARRHQKDEDEKYREAAARLSGGRVRELVAVNRVENDGAFVEVTVWVPRTEIEG